MKNRKRHRKHHYYVDDQVVEEDGYGKTACGRQGRKVGGFIDWFFKGTKVKNRCKICNRRFMKEHENKTV